MKFVLVVIGALCFLNTAALTWCIFLEVIPKAIAHTAGGTAFLFAILGFALVLIAKDKEEENQESLD